MKNEMSFRSVSEESGYRSGWFLRAKTTTAKSHPRLVAVSHTRVFLNAPRFSIKRSCRGRQHLGSVYSLALRVCCCLLFALPAFAQEGQEAWERGNEAYIAGNYPAAIEAWESITGESDRLYYNLGNAYFKNGQLGRSIVLYNKALRLRPSDRDARHNLEIARSRVRVAIVPLPRFFMSRWIDAARGLLSGNGWAAVSLLMLAIALAALLFYLLGKRPTVRKSGFYGAMVAFLLFILALGFALGERREVRNPSSAVVMSEAATVKTAPDIASPDAFILYEGTEIRITGQLDDWREVEIADGNKGWIAASAIEIIR